MSDHGTVIPEDVDHSSKASKAPVHVAKQRISKTAPQSAASSHFGGVANCTTASQLLQIEPTQLAEELERLDDDEVLRQLREHSEAMLQAITARQQARRRSDCGESEGDEGKFARMSNAQLVAAIAQAERSDTREQGEVCRMLTALGQRFVNQRRFVEAHALLERARGMAEDSGGQDLDRIVSLLGRAHEGSHPSAPQQGTQAARRHSCDGGRSAVQKEGVAARRPRSALPVQRSHASSGSPFGGLRGQRRHSLTSIAERGATEPATATRRPNTAYTRAGTCDKQHAARTGQGSTTLLIPGYSAGASQVQDRFLMPLPPLRPDICVLYGF